MSGAAGDVAVAVGLAWTTGIVAVGWPLVDEGGEGCTMAASTEVATATVRTAAPIFAATEKQPRPSNFLPPLFIAAVPATPPAASGITVRPAMANSSTNLPPL